MKYRAHLVVLLLAFLLYGASAGIMLRRQSKTPQYIYLAYSFLHGKLNLIETPELTYDLILYQGRWYVPGALMPAILLLPAVAIWGLGFSDVLFGVVIGSLNVLLMYDLLGSVAVDENKSRRNWLTLLFAAGTVHWWLSITGSVWFNAHVTAVTFMILFVRSALRGKSPWLTGIWLGWAALSRPTALFAAAFYFTLIFQDKNDWREFFRKAFSFSVALAAAIAIMLLYNVLRFGNPMDFGYRYVQGDPGLVSTYTRYGGFSPRYMPCNMYVSLLGMPNITNNPLPNVNTVCSYLEPGKSTFPAPYTLFIPMGMSIFLTTPAFLLMFKAGSPRSLIISTWVGLVCVLMPLWMYHTTGYAQFGYRYVLDIIVFIFILLASGIRKVGWLEILLIVVSVIINAVGMVAMFNLIFKLDWFPMAIGILKKIFTLQFLH